MRDLLTIKRMIASTCCVAGLAGLIWTGPAIFEIYCGDFDLMSDIRRAMPWWWMSLDWLSDQDLEKGLERQVAEMVSEIKMFVWGITTLSIGLLVLGAFLWRKGGCKQEVEPQPAAV